MKDKLLLIIKEAGKMLKEGYYSQKEVTFKAKKDLVTTYDVGIENFLKESFFKSLMSLMLSQKKATIEILNLTTPLSLTPLMARPILSTKFLILASLLVFIKTNNLTWG